VSARLGHASTAVTGAIYAHEIRGRQRHAADEFDAAMNRGNISATKRPSGQKKKKRTGNAT